MSNISVESKKKGVSCSIVDPVNAANLADYVKVYGESKVVHLFQTARTIAIQAAGRISLDRGNSVAQAQAAMVEKAKTMSVTTRVRSSQTLEMEVDAVAKSLKLSPEQTALFLTRVKADRESKKAKAAVSKAKTAAKRLTNAKK